MEVIAAVVRAYYDSLLSVDQLNATNQAHAFGAGRSRTRRVTSAPPECPPMSIHFRSACTWRACASNRSAAQADVDVARAALNDAIGLPLDTPHTLDYRLTPLSLPEASLAD